MPIHFRSGTYPGVKKRTFGLIFKKCKYTALRKIILQSHGLSFDNVSFENNEKALICLDSTN